MHLSQIHSQTFRQLSPSQSDEYVRKSCSSVTARCALSPNTTPIRGPDTSGPACGDRLGTCTRHYPEKPPALLLGPVSWNPRPSFPGLLSCSSTSSRSSLGKGQFLKDFCTRLCTISHSCPLVQRGVSFTLRINSLRYFAPLTSSLGLLLTRLIQDTLWLLFPLWKDLQIFLFLTSASTY